MNAVATHTNSNCQETTKGVSIFTTEQAAQIKEVAVMWKRIYHRLLAKVRDPHLAEELTQQVMLKAIQRIHTSGTVLKVQEYVFWIAHNEWVSNIRQRDAQARNLPLDTSGAEATTEDAEPLFIRTETQEALARAVAALPPVERTCIVLKYLEGRKPAQIRERFRREGVVLSSWAVSRTLEKARDAMKDALGSLWSTVWLGLLASVFRGAFYLLILVGIVNVSFGPSDTPPDFPPQARFVSQDDVARVERYNLTTFDNTVRELLEVEVWPGCIHLSDGERADAKVTGVDAHGTRCAANLELVHSGLKTRLRLIYDADTRLLKTLVDRDGDGRMTQVPEGGSVTVYRNATEKDPAKFVTLRLGDQVRQAFDHMPRHERGADVRKLTDANVVAAFSKYTGRWVIGGDKSKVVFGRVDGNELVLEGSCSMRVNPDFLYANSTGAIPDLFERSHTLSPDGRRITFINGEIWDRSE